jgi:hypothetical protein
MKPAIWKHATSIDIIPPAIIGVFGRVKLIQYGCIKTACGNTSGTRGKSTKPMLRTWINCNAIFKTGKFSQLFDKPETDELNVSAS